MHPSEPPIIPVYPPQSLAARVKPAFTSQDPQRAFEEQVPQTVVNPPLHPDPHDLDLPAFLRKRMRLSG